MVTHWIRFFYIVVIFSILPGCHFFHHHHQEKNTRPIASASVPKNSAVGTTVIFDGSKSSDADHDALTHKWTLLTKPTISLASLTNSNAVQSSLTPDVAGDYVAQLIVNDGKLNSLPTTAKVEVTLPPPGNKPPSITSTPVTTATVGTAYSHQVLASDPDSGDILSYTLENAPTGLAIDSAGLIKWTPEASGDFPVTVKVTDNKNASVTQSFTVTVSPVAIIPKVPNLVGKSRSTAHEDILAAKMTLGTETFQHSADVVDGIIISQSLPADEEAAIGTLINLTISLGPDTGLPSNPETVAPVLDPSTATSTYASTAFLYDGSNPIQTLADGQPLTKGTIEAKRAAVIRGKVLAKDNQPLSGVTITILNHPEFGQALTRTDGQFDLAVNGGGNLIVDYQKPGYLSAQRNIDVPWQDYSFTPDVVLIPADKQVTTIDLNNTHQEFQVVRGSIQNDQDGKRQATLLVPKGTQAKMVMPDNSTSPLTTLSIRASEFTVGTNGPATMPAELPPTIGYTYALDLNADEAKVAGAKEVVFEKPIPFYVENFLKFKTGVPVPLGYYDSEKGAWVATDSGQVIKIVAINNGLADLDTNGDDTADNGAALGITDPEREQLASLYTGGQSLWRVTIPHFTKWDANQGRRCKNNNCKPPMIANEDKPQQEPAAPIDDDNECKVAAASIIECQNQGLGESVQVAGTPFTLNYRSKNMPGRVSKLKIKLTGDSLPDGIKAVERTVDVAGQHFLKRYDAPHQHGRSIPLGRA